MASLESLVTRWTREKVYSPLYFRSSFGSGEFVVLYPATGELGGSKSKSGVGSNVEGLFEYRFDPQEMSPDSPADMRETWWSPENLIHLPTYLREFGAIPIDVNKMGHWGQCFESELSFEYLKSLQKHIEVPLAVTRTSFSKLSNVILGGNLDGSSDANGAFWNELGQSLKDQRFGLGLIPEQAVAFATGWEYEIAPRKFDEAGQFCVKDYIHLVRKAFTLGTGDQIAALLQANLTQVDDYSIQLLANVMEANLKANRLKLILGRLDARIVAKLIKPLD